METLLVLGILLIVIGGIVLAFQGKAVYYYNKKDVIYTFIPFIGGLILSFLIVANNGLIGHSANLAIINILLSFTILFFITLTAINTFKYNNNKVTVSSIVLASKFLLSGVVIFLLIMAFGLFQEKDERTGKYYTHPTGEFIGAGITFSFLLLVKKLIKR